MMGTEVAQCDDGFLKQMWRSEKQKWGAEVVARLTFIFMVWWSYSVHRNSVTHTLDLTSVVSVTCYVYTCICVAFAWIRFVSCHFLLLFFFPSSLLSQRGPQPFMLTFTPTVNLEAAVFLIYMSLDWGRKTEHLEGTHTHTGPGRRRWETPQRKNSNSNRKLLCHSHGFFSPYQLFGRMRRTQ